MSSCKAWEEGREKAVEKCVLPLSFDSHKGSSGRVGVLGGSARYTGAPYYAAMACLHAGADLAYVFCAKEAAMAIKCYSPELMVSPVYSATEFDRVAGSDGNDDSTQTKEELIKAMVSEVASMMERMHVLVIGPGLGRCPVVMEAVARIIKEGISRELSMVVDADALFMLTLEPYRDIFQNYSKVVLTPNVVEYKRLIRAFGDDNDATAFGSVYDNAIVVQKGRHDVISRGLSPKMVCEEVGGMKRSGGLGDVLAGALGTLIAWNEILVSRTGQEGDDSARVLACWTACCLAKQATKRAFDRKKRAMTAPDVLEDLGPAINDMTEDPHD